MTTTRGQAIIALPSDLASHGRLPLRIRDSKGVLVASGLSGDPVLIDKGTYSLSVLLPTGEERFSATPLVIKPQQTIEAEMEAANTRMVMAPAEHDAAALAVPDDAAPMVGSEPDAMAAAPMPVEQTPSEYLADVALAAGAATEQPVILATRLWQERWLKAETGGARSFLVSGLRGDYPIRAAGTPPLDAVDGVDRCLVHDYDRAGEAVLRFSVVPWDQRVGGAGPASVRRIAISVVEGSDPAVIRFRSTEDSEANALLDFLDRGVLATMQEVTEGFIRSAIELMAGPGVSLLRSLLSGYVALRANSLEGLDSFLAALAKNAPSIPDINAQRVEIHARFGQHEAALAAMADALDDDCPWFRSGLTYLYERMTLYAGLPERERLALNSDAEFWQRMQGARRRIGELAPYLVTANSFTTFDIPR